MSKRELDTQSSSSLADEVARDIEQMIRDEGLGNGHRLGTKESLRERYDVAVATFNEAIRLLSARKMITIRPGVRGGIFVASPPPLVRLGQKMLELSGDSVSVADCLIMREALEPLITQDATRFRNTVDVEELRALGEVMFAPDLGVEAYLRANWALHKRIAEITTNEILKHTYLSLLEFVESRLAGVVASGSPVDTGVGARVHRELVEAIASGDSGRATTALEAHAALTADPDRA
ncbi:FadR/GntR family transcriptional regulator [Nocardia grenadensis]